MKTHAEVGAQDSAGGGALEMEGGESSAVGMLQIVEGLTHTSLAGHGVRATTVPKYAFKATAPYFSATKSVCLSRTFRHRALPTAVSR
jgi:hypothetical protein